jgi:alpha-amylase/alpha-mannosidase (GH57 family)
MDSSAVKPGPRGFVVIHGHFYQPPRENPWIEEIEEEHGAQPFYNWNERIAAECYTPNACARVYDGQGRILNIVNNYGYLNYNFGPTLLSWLADHAPLTYERLLAADRASQARLGHGNAIAQAYNHVILPLATPRDRETEVIWGLTDFEVRFGRRAEALWLPETAVNYPTLATLVEHGLKYVILSPHQAKRVRPLTGGPWEPVTGETLDTTQPYRCFLPEGAGDPAQRHFIDVFFYDGQVASEISFGDLLVDSYRLVERLTARFNPAKAGPQLMHVATDGENYGHHKKFGELALAHALTEALPQKGFTVTNYGAFLELSPPRLMVELALGPRGEGSSWSCAHGVERWRGDCGCATGGNPRWHQRWRTPLREAFDDLNQRLGRIFEEEGGKYLRDPWAARNSYIEVILDRRPEVLQRFFDREGRPGLPREQWVTALRLLEMQRHVLLMYTSCGWFFADVAGLETLQVLKYAARALQLGQYAADTPLEEPFLTLLEKAVSNHPEEGNGRRIFERRIKPAVVDFPKIVNHWVISWLKARERQCPTHIYHFRVDPRDLEVETHASLSLASGRLTVASGITQATQELAFFTAHLGSYLYRTQVLRNPTPIDYLALKQELFKVLKSAPEDLIPLLARRLGDTYLTVHDVFQEEKEQIFHDLLAANQEEAVAQVMHLFEEARPLLEAMAAEHLGLPRLYRALGEIALNRRLVLALRRFESEPWLLPASEEVALIIEEASRLNLKLESREGALILSRILERHLKDLAAGLHLEAADRLQAFLTLMGRIPMQLNLLEPQNFFFRLLEEHFPALAARSQRDPGARQLAETLVNLAGNLGFSRVRYLKLLA